MSHTNLVLGGEWAAMGMPDHVEVSVEGASGSTRYAPERTCRNEAAEPGVIFECSECGAAFVNEPIDGEWSYCPNCGAKVVEP